MRCAMESLFLLALSDEEFLAALAMASSEAFFNKLLVALPHMWSCPDFAAPVSVYQGAPG
jgi:hypothetical protein